jgi:hypothetical protein
MGVCSDEIEGSLSETKPKGVIFESLEGDERFWGL